MRFLRISTVLLVVLAASQASAVTVVNGNFDAGLTGWTWLGSVSDGGGFARIEEHSVLIMSTLGQQITIPAAAATLSFDYTMSSTPDVTSGSIVPDSFVASLVDPVSFESLLDMTVGPPDFFLQQDRGGAVGVLAGKVSISGDTVTVDISSIPAGTDAAVFFDLLGTDDGFSTRVDVDNVHVSLVPEPLTLTGLALSMLSVGAYLRRRRA